MSINARLCEVIISLNAQHDNHNDPEQSTFGYNVIGLNDTHILTLTNDGRILLRPYTMTNNENATSLLNRSLITLHDPIEFQTSMSSIIGTVATIRISN